VAVLAGLEAVAGLGFTELRPAVAAWCEEITACSDGDTLLNAAGDKAPHLWGHLQEAALAQASVALGEPRWIQRAQASADALLMPAAVGGFASDAVAPFDVSSVVLGLAAVGSATGDVKYHSAAYLARSWFSGRNTAGAPVYNPVRGLVHDGIDRGALNPNSGAESNIEGGLALVDTGIVAAYQAHRAGGMAPHLAAAARPAT
jgi:hypothetical protein